MTNDTHRLTPPTGDVGLDCGSHSCLFASNKHGQRTNGPCTCLTGSRAEVQIQRAKLSQAFTALKSELAEARRDLEWLMETGTAIHRTFPPAEYGYFAYNPGLLKGKTIIYDTPHEALSNAIAAQRGEGERQ